MEQQEAARKLADEQNNSTGNPLADENSDEYKAEYGKLEGLHRPELDALFTRVDGQDPKTFANKGELIKALLAFRAK